MATGTYAIFGQTLPLEPTEAGWIPQKSLGRTGAGFESLPAVFSYELRWGLMKKSEFNDLMQIFNSTSGTIVPVSLPEFDSDTYEFYTYTGCIVNKPMAGKYFVENVRDVNLLITSIGTHYFRSI